MKKRLTGVAIALAIMVAYFGGLFGTSFSAEPIAEDEDGSFQEDAESAKSSEESASIRERYFYGGLQKRVETTFEQMEDDVQVCVGKLGEESQVRELAFMASRDNRRAGFRVDRVTTRPEEDGCGRKMAEAIVEAVGSSVSDDFDTYVVAAVHRPTPGGECDGEGQEDALCVQIAQGVVEEEYAFDRDCAESWVDAIQQARWVERGCYSPRHYPEQVEAKDPLSSRAFILSELQVGQGHATVVMRVNQPWVHEMAGCLSEIYAEMEIPADELEESCRSSLRSFVVTYAADPVFSFVLE